MASKKISKKTDFLDKFLDFILTKNYAKYLTLIVLIGAILRYIIIKNVSFLGDEMVHGPHAIGMWKSGLISTILESPAWFYLTDIAHKIFGVTIFSTRFLSFFYGTLTILVVYLLAKEIFNKKTAIVSAALLAISSYHIRYALMEMDEALVFFVLLAAYTFIKYFKTDNSKYLYATGLLIGAGILIKTITAFFLPVFIVFYFIFIKSKKKISIKNLKPLMWLGIIIFLLCSPILIHNILLYQEKGVVDTYFAQYFDINREVHSGQLGYDKGFDIKQVWNGSITIIGQIFLKLEPIIFLLGVLGIAFAIKKAKSKESAFLISLLIFGYLVLIISNLLPTHYVTFIPFLTIYAGLLLTKISELKWIKKGNIFLITAIIVILLANIFLIPANLLPHLTSQTANAGMREFTINNIEDSALVVADSRIYRGRIAWLFNDKHYLESVHFMSLLNEGNKLPPEQLTPITTYFIECTRDDCGWGTVTAGDLNDSSESLVAEFKKSGPPIIEFKSGGGYDEETNMPYFNVYKSQIYLHPQALEFASQTHMWFYYPVNYEPKEKSWDYIELKGFFQKLFHKFGFLMLYLGILIALLAPLILFYELKKQK